MEFHFTTQHYEGGLQYNKAGWWGNRAGTYEKQPSLAMYDLMGLRLSEPDHGLREKKSKGGLSERFESFALLCFLLSFQVGQLRS